LPFAPGNSRKRGPELSQGSQPDERRGGAPKGERVPLNARPRPKRVWMATSDAWRGPTGQLRLFGAPPPLIFLEAKAWWLGRQTSGASALRERDRSHHQPPRSGGG